MVTNPAAQDQFKHSDDIGASIILGVYECTYKVAGGYSSGTRTQHMLQHHLN